MSSSAWRFVCVARAEVLGAGGRAAPRGPTARAARVTETRITVRRFTLG
jgi:hypothetical protein